MRPRVRLKERLRLRVWARVTLRQASVRTRVLCPVNQLENFLGTKSVGFGHIQRHTLPQNGIQNRRHPGGGQCYGCETVTAIGLGR